MIGTLWPTTPPRGPGWPPRAAPQQSRCRAACVAAGGPWWPPAAPRMQRPPPPFPLLASRRVAHRLGVQGGCRRLAAAPHHGWRALQHHRPPHRQRPAGRPCAPAVAAPGPIGRPAAHRPSSSSSPAAAVVHQRGHFGQAGQNHRPHGSGPGPAAAAASVHPGRGRLQGRGHRRPLGRRRRRRDVVAAAAVEVGCRGVVREGVRGAEAEAPTAAQPAGKGRRGRHAPCASTAPGPQDLGHVKAPSPAARGPSCRRAAFRERGGGGSGPKCRCGGKAGVKCAAAPACTTPRACRALWGAMAYTHPPSTPVGGNCLHPSTVYP